MEKDEEKREIKKQEEKKEKPVRKKLPAPDGRKKPAGWHVQREYQGCFSAEEAVGLVIRAHMEAGR